MRYSFVLGNLLSTCPGGIAQGWRRGEGGGAPRALPAHPPGPWGLQPSMRAHMVELAHLALPPPTASASQGRNIQRSSHWDMGLSDFGFLFVFSPLYLHQGKDQISARIYPWVTIKLCPQEKGTLCSGIDSEVAFCPG